MASGRMDSSFFLFLPVRQVPPLLPTAKGCVLGREKLDLLYQVFRATASPAEAGTAYLTGLPTSGMPSMFSVLPVT